MECFFHLFFSSLCELFKQAFLHKHHNDSLFVSSLYRHTSTVAGDLQWNLSNHLLYQFLHVLCLVKDAILNILPNWPLY